MCARAPAWARACDTISLLESIMVCATCICVWLSIYLFISIQILCTNFHCNNLVSCFICPILESSLHAREWVFSKLKLKFMCVRGWVGVLKLKLTKPVCVFQSLNIKFKKASCSGKKLTLTGSHHTSKQPGGSVTPYPPGPSLVYTKITLRLDDTSSR